MHLFIINLIESTERRSFMNKQLTDLGISNFTFITAIKGSNLSESEVCKVYNQEACHKINKRDLSRNEIGCALSHQHIYELMIRSGYDQAVVLEDDVLLLADFVDILTELDSLKLDNTVIKLDLYKEIRSLKYHERPFINGYTLQHPLSEVQMCWAYYLDIKAASKLKKINFPVKTMADDWFYFKNKIKLRVLSKAVVTESGLPSDIGERPGAERKHPWKLVRKVKRITNYWQSFFQ